jgi:hypothetical protein
MIVYATLNQLRDRLGLAADTDRDARLLAALRQATAQIDRYTARRFAPVLQTRRHDYQTPAYLGLNHDLLELLSLTNGDGAAIDPAGVTLVPAGDGPYRALVLSPGSPAAFTYVDSLVQAIAVGGIWGWHDAWAEAWRSSGDTLQEAVDEDDALLSVEDAAGADGLNLTPRFQVGQLIRLGEEYAHVTTVDAEADTISVIRGVRGTAAESHAAGTALEVYVPPEDVQALCLRWAAWLYQQADAAIGTGAEWLYPPDLPADLQRLAEPLRNVRVA